MKRNGDYSSPRKLFKNTNIDATYLGSVYLHDIVFQKQDFGLCLTNQFLVLTMLSLISKLKSQLLRNMLCVVHFFF